MTTKTYRAPTMLAALQIVQKELGPDAIVLSMRQSEGKSFWKKGYCEVIAMPGLPGAPKRSAGAQASPVAEPAPKTGARKIALAEPHTQPKQVVPPIVPPPVRTVSSTQTRQVYQMKSGLASENENEPQCEAETQLLKKDIPNALLRLQDHLKSQGIEAGLLNTIMTTCVRVVTPLGMQDKISLENMARRVMEAQVKVNPRPNTFPPTRIMCLIGPSGSGKTSTCAKLAYTYAKKLGKKVIWISADTIRTGAISETRAYTEGLGVPLELAYLPEELEQAVTSHPDADLILVDTPRCNPYREDSLVELATYLTRVPGRSTYLVLPATMKEVDLRQMQSNLRVFSPRGEIITKLDETSAMGSVYNLACQGLAPLTFFTSGTSLSSGLHPASAETLVNAVLSGRFEA